MHIATAYDLTTKTKLWRIEKLNHVQQFAIAPSRSEVFIWMDRTIRYPGKEPPNATGLVESYVVSLKTGELFRKRPMSATSAEGRDHKVALWGDCFYSSDESEIAIFDDRGLTVLDAERGFRIQAGLVGKTSGNGI